MPEGDSVFRAASRVRVECVGRAVLDAETRGPGPSFGRLRGATLDEIETHGKNLFFKFSSGLVVHVHLRMTGKLRVVPGTASSGAFRARFVLGPREGAASEAKGEGTTTLLFLGAPVVRLVTRSELVTIRERLGADPLRGEISEPEVVEKVLSYDGTLGEALLVQRVMAGVGNIVKCEALFLAKADPFLSCASCTEETAGRVVAKADRAPAGLGRAEGRRPARRRLGPLRDAVSHDPGEARPLSPRRPPREHLGLRPRGGALPRLWDADRHAPTRAPSSHHLLLPHLPSRWRAGHRRSLSAHRCHGASDRREPTHDSSSVSDPNPSSSRWGHVVYGRDLRAASAAPSPEPSCAPSFLAASS
jgi:formamidopyrimidine-DNA glycosylase